MAIDMDKLHAFLGTAIVDFGATFNAALVRIGDKLGLYKGLATGGPQTAAELAEAYRNGRAVCSRMAELPGGWRLRDLRRGYREISFERRAGLRDGGRK